MLSALSESCMKFRLETLAPSGGWLASVAIGLSLKTGIYEYTILATIFMVSFVILRTASCESAMVLALAYDLVIPFQYQNVQRHLSELEKYWPKFLMGTMIEAGCYLLLHSDLFNIAVIIKTSVLLVIWMRGKKQYPLNLAKDRQASAAKASQSTSQPQNTANPTTTAPKSTSAPKPQDTNAAPSSSSSSSSSTVTPEYLQYVKKGLEKCKGDLLVKENRIQDHLRYLQEPAKSKNRLNTEVSLGKRNVMKSNEWKAAQGGGGGQGAGPAGGQRQGSSAQGGQAAQPRETNHTANSTPSSKTTYQWTKPTDADIKQLKLDLEAKKSSFDKDAVIGPLLAGPSRSSFAEMLNYLRWKRISTRKWVPMVPADKTMYRVPDPLIDEVMEWLSGDIKAKIKLSKPLKASYPKLTALRNANANLRNKGIRLPIPEEPGDEWKCNRVTPHGEIWYDILQKVEAAKREGPDKVAEIEAMYDFLNDPYNKSKKDEQTKRWIAITERDWSEINLLHKEVENNDWLPGTAGIPITEIAGYREQLDKAGDLAETIKDAMLSGIKNSPTAQQGRELAKEILEQAKTLLGKRKLMDEWNDKTEAGKEYLASVKRAEAQEAADAAEPA